MSGDECKRIGHELSIIEAGCWIHDENNIILSIFACV